MKKPIIHTHTHCYTSGKLETPISLQFMDRGKWCTERKPQMHGEKMKTPHTQGFEPPTSGGCETKHLRFLFNIVAAPCSDSPQQIIQFCTFGFLAQVLPSSYPGLGPALRVNPSVIGSVPWIGIEWSWSFHFRESWPVKRITWWKNKSFLNLSSESQTSHDNCIKKKK